MRAMLKDKEGLPFVINSVFLTMLKKMVHVWDGQMQLLVCVGVACSEAHELELDILTKAS